MNHGLDISQLESQEKIVKSLAKIAIFSSTTSVIVLLYGFIIPDPVIFLSIVLIPIAIVIANNSIERMYQRKTEFLLNDLQSEEFIENISSSRGTDSKQSIIPIRNTFELEVAMKKGLFLVKITRTSQLMENGLTRWQIATMTILKQPVQMPRK